MTLSSKLRNTLFDISLEEATFQRRGFRAGNDCVRLRLENIGKTFISGYLTVLDIGDHERVSIELDKVEADFRGFAYEGAAMGFSLLDAFTPWNRQRFDKFLAGPGQSHVYMAHVGAGWAAARVPWVKNRLHRFLSRFDPLLRWLVVDGFGFHQGYFHPLKFVRARAESTSLRGYMQRAFDQGLGRSLWFVCGADVQRIAAAIDGFPPQRHGDLWSGVGLACVYAGGVGRDEIAILRSAAQEHRADLAQGAVFAASARQLARNATDYTHMACKALCKTTLDEAVILKDRALKELPPGCHLSNEGDLPAYEHWRSRIRNHFAEQDASGEMNHAAEADQTREQTLF